MSNDKFHLILIFSSLLKIENKYFLSLIGKRNVDMMINVLADTVNLQLFKENALCMRNSSSEELRVSKSSPNWSSIEMINLFKLCLLFSHSSNGGTNLSEREGKTVKCSHIQVNIFLITITWPDNK